MARARVYRDPAFAAFDGADAAASIFPPPALMLSLPASCAFLQAAMPKNNGASSTAAISRFIFAPRLDVS
jgi:hypothetical protein